MPRQVVVRDSDGETIDIAKEQAEHADVTARAHRSIITDGTDTVDIISTNGFNGIVALAPGHVSTDNSTITPLVGDANFTGDWEEITNFGVIVISITSDVASATDGLLVEFSSDGTIDGIISDDVFTVAAGAKKTFSFQAAAQFYRVIYTNGSSTQSNFNLQTVLKPYYVKPSSHRIQDNIVDDDDAELTKSVLTAKKDDDTFINISASDSENLRVANSENNLNIAQGNVISHSVVHKFGRGANIDTADGFVVLWDGAEYNDTLKTYTYSTSADIDRISSDNDTDTVELEIQGLDTNYNLVTQTKTLTGQTPVALDTSLIRIFRMKNIDSTDIVGNVFCFVNVATTLGVPDTITNTRAMIHDGNNQTLMAIYTVPARKTAYIINWYGALSSAKASSFNNLEMKSRAFGSVFQLKHTSTLSSAGTSYIQHVFNVPQEFPEKTDFVMLSDSSVNDNAVSAGFDLVIIDN